MKWEVWKALAAFFGAVAVMMGATLGLAAFLALHLH
jgi:hypothetical protein